MNSMTAQQRERLWARIEAQLGARLRIRQLKGAAAIRAARSRKRRYARREVRGEAPR